MIERIRLGMLTPSSNTVLEPMTAAMLSGLPDVTAHFSRLRVKEISLDDAALNQFDAAPFLAAADLLADAQVNVICWNGTSGGWLGFEADAKLCHDIEAATGIAACTSTRALTDAFETMGTRRYALVTPYLPDVQNRIVTTFAKAGFACVAERHLNDRGNFSFAEFSEAQISGMVREVALAKPDAIAIYCTNFRGTGIVAALEDELGIPVIDSVAVSLWKSLLMAGGDPTRVRGWGRLFGYGPPSDKVSAHG